MANNQYVNKVVYGDQNVLDLSEDTFDDALQLVEGKTAHKKNGEQVTGTRPLFYKYNSSKCFVGNYPITVPNEGSSVDICALNPKPPLLAFYIYTRYIALRQSGTNIQLFCKKDSSTESAVTIATISNATLRATFKIEKIHFLDSMHIIIEYRYQANTSGYLSPLYIRCIIMKLDGSLIAGSQVEISGTPSATIESDGWLTQGLYGDFMCVYSNKTISSGARTLVAKRMYLNHITGAFTKDTNSSIVSITTANVNVYVNNFTVAPTGSGFFYKDNSGVASVVLFGSYQSGNYRKWTLADAGSEIANIGAEKHWILGIDSYGHIVTLKQGNTVYTNTFYFWAVDLTSTTNAWNLITSRSFNSYDIGINSHKVIGFKNNVVTFRLRNTTTLLRFQIEQYESSNYFYYRLTEINSATVLTALQEPSLCAGPETDLFNGVLLGGQG